MEANNPETIVTTLPAPAEPTKDRLAESKKKFDELLAKRRVATEPAPAAEAADEKEPSAPAAEKAEDKPAAATEPAKAKNPETEKLRNKLLLAGNPKRAVESLDDDEVVEWWKRQEERERTASLALQRASDLERQLQEATGKKPEEPQAVPTSEAPDLDELEDVLKDQFGEDESKALISALRAVVDPIRKENDQIKAVIAEAQKTGRAQLEQRNRDRLAKELPALKESNVAWSAIQREAQDRFTREPTKYASPDEAYSEAFKELYGSVLPAKSATPDEPDTGKAKARISASALTPPSSQKSTKRSTPADASRAAFLYLQKNPGDTEGARRAYDSLLA